MSEPNSALMALAEAAGIAAHWQDYQGQTRTVADEVLRALLSALELPCASAGDIADSRAQLAAESAAGQWPALLTGEAGRPLPLPACAAELPTIDVLLEAGGQRRLPVTRTADGRPWLAAIPETGYHLLLVGSGSPPTLAIAPAQAFPISALAEGRRLQGLVAQLASLRRAGDGGIGDFGGLARLVAAAAPAGVDALAISPTNALYAGDPDRYAPYSPSSRLFLNPLHADPAMVLGAAAVASALAASGLAGLYAELEALPLIDYPRAARAKWRLLRALWQAQAGELEQGESPLARRFRAYRASGGRALLDHACFEALQVAQGGADWRRWPAGLRECGSVTVQAYAADHAAELGFHCFAQWLAADSLAAAQAGARASGMRIGLIGDLAVGTDGGGSHAWSCPHELLRGVSIGAPPDPLGPLGQNWGLTTFSPRALKAQGYRPFLELLRANLRHAGGIRIDHVLGLRRLWLAPEGAAPGAGAYLRYPTQDLLRLVALESQRHRAVVLGEDLGTLPEGFQAELADAGVLGLRVLYFQREHKLFVEPERWSASAVATTSTHDLPTVAGWWAGRDLDWRRRLDLVDAEAQASEEAEREEGRQCLWSALEHAGLVEGARPEPAAGAAVVDAACAFVARSPAPLLLLPLEDLLGLEEAPNLPGTVSGHPNWQRRLPGEAGQLLDQAGVGARLALVRRERGV